MHGCPSKTKGFEEHVGGATVLSQSGVANSKSQVFMQQFSALTEHLKCFYTKSHIHQGHFDMQFGER